MFIAVASGGIYAWATPSAKFEKDMEKVGAWIRRRIRNRRLPTVLPEDLPFFDASFYASGGQISNLAVGTHEGYEYICFDWDPCGEVSSETTVVALRAAQPVVPMTWLAESAGIRLERVGDWVFAHDPEKSISRNQRLQFIDEIRTFLEYATEFPQNR
jgi:hypothetical protein